MKRNLMLFLIAPLLMSNTIPEAYVSDMEKMRAYFEKEELSIQLKYDVFSQTTNKLLDTKTGQYCKSKSNYFFEIDGISIIQNDQWNLYLNETEKIMAVKEKKEESGAAIMSFDEATKGCETVIRTNADDYYLYTIQFKKPVSSVYSSVQIYAQKSDLKPIRIIFDYAQQTTQTDQNGTLITDKLRLVIHYLKIESHSDQSFTTDQFFRLSGDKLETVSQYSDYQLYDQRIQNLIK